MIRVEDFPDEPDYERLVISRDVVSADPDVAKALCLELGFGDPISYDGETFRMMEFEDAYFLTRKKRKYQDD